MADEPNKEPTREVDQIAALLDLYETAYLAGEPLVSDELYDLLVDRYWILLEPF